MKFKREVTLTIHPAPLFGGTHEMHKQLLAPAADVIEYIDAPSEVDAIQVVLKDEVAKTKEGIADAEYKIAEAIYAATAKMPDDFRDAYTIEKNDDFRKKLASAAGVNELEAFLRETPAWWLKPYGDSKPFERVSQNDIDDPWMHDPWMHRNSRSSLKGMDHHGLYLSRKFCLLPNVLTRCDLFTSDRLGRLQPAVCFHSETFTPSPTTPMLADVDRHPFGDLGKAANDALRGVVERAFGKEKIVDLWSHNQGGISAILDLPLNHEVFGGHTGSRRVPVPSKWEPLY